jgi:lipoate-protein ligase A
MDMAMLEEAARQAKILLRLYRWSVPTLSLGYFQSYEERLLLPELVGMACVRRVTGGGAILHDQELTYAIAIPEGERRKGPAEAVYRGLHRAIVAWLRKRGWAAQFWEELAQAEGGAVAPATPDPFLCFDRRSAVDIVVGDRKVLGSAQRRTSLGLLQHGSLLLKASPARPQLRGLLDPPHIGSPADAGSSAPAPCLPAAADRQLPEELAAALQAGLEEILHVRWGIGQPSRHCLDRAADWEKNRFGNPRWTQAKER